MKPSTDPITRLGHEPPVEWLLHPVTLGALLVMILNDGWLRSAHPGWVTGKLSDLAAVIAFPAVIAAVWGLAVLFGDRLVGLARPFRGLDYSLHRSVVLGSLGLTGGILAGINLSAPLRDAYLAALSHLDVLDLFGPFHYTMDPTDLLALVGLLGPWWVAERLLKRIPGGRLRVALRRASQRVAAAPADQREAEARGAIHQTLNDVHKGLSSERTAALDRLTEVLVQTALARVAPHEGNLAPKDVDHYHRIQESLEDYRTAGKAP